MKDEFFVDIVKGCFGYLESEYDFIILDCPPNLTLLSENIITAADCVLTPVVPTTRFSTKIWY